jgi:hypothetical protein
MIDVQVNEKHFQNYREQFDFTAMPKEFMEWYENADLTARDKWMLQRFKCLSNHLFLAGSVMVSKA